MVGSVRWRLRCAIRVSRCVIRDTGYGIRDSGFKISRISYLVTRIPKPVPRDSHPVARIVTSPTQCPTATSNSERLSRSIAPNQEHLTDINIMFILSPVIQTFADSEAERFYTAGKSRRMPPEIRKRAAMRLLQYNVMRLPKSGICDYRLPTGWSSCMEIVPVNGACASMTSGAYASALRTAII